MKRIITFMMAIAILMFAAFSAVSCGDDCEAHVDGDLDGFCDECEAEMPEDESIGDDTSEEPAEVEIAITVKDQDGEPVTGVVINFGNSSNSAYNAAAAATDAEGKTSVKLHVGSYGITYDDVPAGYLSGASSVTVTEQMTSFNIDFTNNIPNGTMERPYHFSYEDPTVAIPAQTSYYYVVYHAVNLVLYIDGEGYTITYEGEEYTAIDGHLELALAGEDTNSVAMLKIENKQDSDITFSAYVKSLPGSYENPIVLEVGEDGAAAADIEDLIYEKMVYYTYTAAADGVVAVSTEDSNVHIVVNNGSVQQNNGNGESGSVYIEVSAGDELKIGIATTDKSATEVGVDISFEVSLNRGE